MHATTGAMVFVFTVLAVGQVPSGIVTTKEPVNRAGVAAICDLPAQQHIRNRGGNDRTRDNPFGEPGRGYGLCVFTSVEVAARWQAVRELDGFQDWMTRRPGGGYPEKLDRMLAAYCKERNVAVPVYVQHTGGDEAFLDLVVKTDRLACVTYAGMDGFYKDARGRDTWIDHMVNLAHLDAEYAAVIDNNRPGVWVWMSRKDFLVRWRARGGGWAVVLLHAPPPPHLPRTGAELPSLDLGRFRNPEKGDKRYLKVGITVTRTESTYPNFGVESGHFRERPSYTISGVEVSREEAHAALIGGPLVDDSNRWHLTAVGDARLRKRFLEDVTELPAEIRAKLHIQTYGPEEWPVAHFQLPTGVSLRKPSPGRIAPEVGVVAEADYTFEKLTELLNLITRIAPAPPPRLKPTAEKIKTLRES